MANKSKYGATRKGLKCPLCERAVNGKRQIIKENGVWTHVECIAWRQLAIQVTKNVNRSYCSNLWAEVIK